MAVAAFLLGGCAHHMSVMRSGNLLTVSGKVTAGDSQPVAAAKMLRRAARLTLDHGYRYFTIDGPVLRDGLPAVNPGANMAIRLYRPGEIEPGRTGVFDAMRIASDGL